MEQKSGSSSKDPNGASSDGSKRGADPSVFQAILFKRHDELRNLLDTSRSDYIFHLKAKDELGRTALYLACQRGELDVVDLIIATGAANIETADNNGWSPLFVSCFNGKFDVAEKLLELSANVDTKENLFGWTPIMAAVWNGHCDLIELLLSNNASLDQKDKNGRTPLFLAAERGHGSVVDILLKKKVDINETDSHGRTSLYIAVQMSHAKIVEQLAESGASLEIADVDGRRPLFLAYKSVNEEIAEYLVSKGANTEALEGDRSEGEGEPTKPCRGKLLTELNPNPPVKVVSFVQLDGRVWGGCNDGTIIIWNASDRTLLCYYERVQKKPIHHMVIINKHVWALSGYREIYVWKWNDNPSAEPKNVFDGKNRLALMSTLQQGTEINCLMRTSTEVYGGSFNGTVYIWNSKIFTCREVKLATPPGIKLADYENFISCLTLHGSNLFAAALKYVMCYDAKTFTYKYTLEGHNGLITAMVAIGPNLWTASKDNKIRVWNVESKQCVKVFDNVGGSQVTALVHTKDDQVLSGGGDGSIKSWSAGSLEWKRTFPLKHDREVTGLYWDDTTNMLWAGGLDKRITIWK